MSEIDALLENKELTEMLEFETQLFLDILHKDGLVVAAKGLTFDHVLLNFFKVYCDPGNLIIVLNCTELEEKYFVEKLHSEHVHSTTFTTSVTEREDVYLSGGIHFITTRILVVDLLKKRIPIEKITGIVVFRAHSVLESCQEAFVLRLYRQHNKTGFIKAFSNCAQSFTVGFGHVERIMRTLFVKELYIWPRFHSLVIQSFKRREPKVIEIHIPMSNAMSKIQTCLLDLMNLTVNELKRINKTFEMQEITVENCLTKTFHKILVNRLDEIWHQLSEKTKQLISDLRTLRNLIITMLYTDPITFYSLVCSYRTMEYAQTSTWVLLQPAETLFTTAAAMVYAGDKEFDPELCPKWSSLSEILKTEIPADIKKLNLVDSKVLILCQDRKTCYQLKEYLIQGPHRYLFSTALKHHINFKSINENFKACKTLSREETTAKLPKKGKLESSEENPLDETEDFRDSYFLTMSQTFNENSESEKNSDEDYVFEPFDEMENMNLTQICDSIRNKPVVLIQTFKVFDNAFFLQNTLNELQPNFIILYHANMTAVRQIELYEARKTEDIPLKVYFLIHAATVEEQSYLTTLRKEKESFEYLIETKSTMVVPEDQDGKSEDCGALQINRDEGTVSTRQGGEAETRSDRNLVVVDIREFRSELPALLHKRGMEIEPVTITVGDYILTPEICLERKSLSDLIGSLNSGRLYQQCVQMTRCYVKPMLLIEFDQNKPFSWQNHYMLSSDGNSFDVQQKLLLLTLHFPKLKIIWSPSPYASAQLMEELKVGKEQPNVEYAASIGSEQDLDLLETKYNVGIYDFIQKLPGISFKNIDRFLKNAKNLDQIIKMSEEELNGILDNSVDARALYSALHEEHVPKDIKGTTKSKGKLQNKFKYTKK